MHLKRHCFGSLFSLKAQDSLQFLDDQKHRILYPVGNYFALRSVENSNLRFTTPTENIGKINEIPDMKFIPLPENWDRVTCMKMSHDKHYLVLGGKLQNDNAAHLYIYQHHKGSLKFEKFIQPSDTPTTSKEFKTVAFSGDLKFICGFTMPDCRAYMWEWPEKVKLIADSVINAVVERISIHPKDKHLACTTGQQHFRLWTIQDGAFKGSPVGHVDEKQNFKDHAWLEEDKLVVCNDSGDIYIIDRVLNKVIQKSNAFNGGELDHFSITCITPYGKGFFVGSEEGLMSLWVRSEENNKTTGKDPYDFIRKWMAAEKMRAKIVSMAVSFTEDMLAVGFATNEIGVCDISSIGLNQDFRRAREYIDKEVKFEIVCSGFHSKAINSMDVAIQKPLIVTCSKDDATIRVWNYLNFRCELARKFYVKEDSKGMEATRPITCVAFHPSGYYIAAGFIDRLRFFHILHNTLRLYREVAIKKLQ